MTGRSCRIRKYTLFFLKICIVFKNGHFVKTIWGKKLIFSCDFDFFYDSIKCAIKFHADEIFVFSFYLFRSKVIAVFVKNLPKLNILSVIAID